MVALVFTLGHVLVLPDRFGLDAPLPALGILAMGLVCASIRAWTGSIVPIIALHLDFSVLFA